MAKNKPKRAPKTVLKLPDLEQSKSAVLNSLTSLSSQRSYDHAIREFIEWYCSEPRLAFNKTVVTRYRISLEQAHYASSTINLRLAAVRRLAYEAADSGLLSPDLAAGIRRVKGAKKLGMRVGNWLTAEQGKRHHGDRFRRLRDLQGDGAVHISGIGVDAGTNLFRGGHSALLLSREILIRTQIPNFASSVVSGTG